MSCCELHIATTSKMKVLEYIAFHVCVCVCVLDVQQVAKDPAAGKCDLFLDYIVSMATTRYKHSQQLTGACCPYHQPTFSPYSSPGLFSVVF